MTAAQVDDVTFWVWLGKYPVWLVLELLLLMLRGEGVSVGTLSIVAKTRGRQLTAAIYFDTAMPIHWWAPIGWATAWGTVVFWVLQALLLVWNIIRWRATARPVEEWPRWERWLNWPVWYLAAGPAAAALLFPQGGWVPWGLP